MSVYDEQVLDPKEPIYAIGDVHGCREALEALIENIAPTPRTQLVFLGDYIDRGPDSKGCIDSLLRFQETSRAQVVTLLGNHEDAFLRALDDPHHYSWLTIMQGLATVRSYSAAASDELTRAIEAAGPQLILGGARLPYGAFVDAIPADHLTFFRNLKLFHRTDDAVCVHAGLDPRRGPVEAQTRQAMLWGPLGFLTDYNGPDLVMYGHWDDADLDANDWPRPAIGPARIGVDTISHGVLTAFSLPDRRVYQSARFL